MTTRSPGQRGARGDRRRAEALEVWALLRRLAALDTTRYRLVVPWEDDAGDVLASLVDEVNGWLELHPKPT